MANTVGHILVVEDNPALLAVIAQSLRRVDLEVTTAGDGIEALEKLEETSIDLVLTDFNMPRMDGGTLCRKMREHDRFRSIPVVFLTAYSEEFEREFDLDSLGIADVIRKPFSPRVIRARVLELVGQVRGRSNETTVTGTDVPHSQMSD